MTPGLSSAGPDAALCMVSEAELSRLGPQQRLALTKDSEYKAPQREPGTGFAHVWFVRAPDDYLWS